MRFNSVLFDLDGTLVDPRMAITHSVHYALTQFGVQDVTPDDLLAFIGPPLMESFERYFGLTGEDGIRAIGHYREHFSELGPRANIPYPDIELLLERLNDAGVLVTIATSKPTVFAEEIVIAYGFDRWVDLVVGSNLDHSRTAKAEVIAHLLDERPQIRAGSVIMVGDREHDVIGARAHGIDTVGAIWGYGSPGELQRAGALHLTNDVRELGSLLGAW
ncbi:MAG: HAD hydrolase-like protein [Thermomicrobiales bacterium]|nr:HAD hydrolase-like protein [Thermomicrobiales bacterium]